MASFLHFADAYLRGASQVVVINNPISGVLVILACLFPSTIVGVHGMLGLLGATFMAYLLDLDEHALTSGLFGYNGLLVGMAFGTFLERSTGVVDAAIAVASVLLGGFSSIIQLALGNALVPTFKTPPFTLAFNTTMILFLLASSHFAPFSMPHHHEAPVEASVETPVTPPATAVDVGWLMRSALVSVGQVFLCDSIVCGALIIGAMAISSRIAACAAYAGALSGSALALALGVETAQIGHGLWGYNSCLTAIVVVTFFVPSVKGCVVGAIGIALTVLLDAALRTAAAPLPIGTLPFCFSSLLLLLTQSSIPGFDVIPLDEVATVEDHLYTSRVGKITVLSYAMPDDETADAGEAEAAHATGTLTANAANADAMGEVMEMVEVVVDERQRPGNQREAIVISPRSRRPSLNMAHALQMPSPEGSAHGRNLFAHMRPPSFASREGSAHSQNNFAHMRPSSRESSGHSQNNFAHMRPPSRESSAHGRNLFGEIAASTSTSSTQYRESIVISPQPRSRRASREASTSPEKQASLQEGSGQDSFSEMVALSLKLRPRSRRASREASTSQYASQLEPLREGSGRARDASANNSVTPIEEEDKGDLSFTTKRTVVGNQGQQSTVVSPPVRLAGIIDNDKRVTHIASPDANGQVVSEPIAQHETILESVHPTPTTTSAFSSPNLLPGTSLVNGFAPDTNMTETMNSRVATADVYTALVHQNGIEVDKKKVVEMMKETLILKEDEDVASTHKESSDGGSTCSAGDVGHQKAAHTDESLISSP